MVNNMVKFTPDMTVGKSAGFKLTLSRTTDQNDRNTKPYEDHNSEQVQGPRLEPGTNSY